MRCGVPGRGGGLARRETAVVPRTSDATDATGACARERGACQRRVSFAPRPLLLLPSTTTSSETGFHGLSFPMSAPSRTSSILCSSTHERNSGAGSSGARCTILRLSGRAGARWTILRLLCSGVRQEASRRTRAGATCSQNGPAAHPIEPETRDAPTESFERPRTARAWRENGDPVNRVVHSRSFSRKGKLSSVGWPER